MCVACNATRLQRLMKRDPARSSHRPSGVSQATAYETPAAWTHRNEKSRQHQPGATAYRDFSFRCWSTPEFQVGDAATAEVPRPGGYGFVQQGTAEIAGGVGGGDGFGPRVLFYVGVDDVEAALARAESLGGTRRMGPEPKTGGDFCVGWFADPEGNVVGVAGPPVVG